MRILLAQNSLYYPSHGGGDISNRLLMEALAARGHACRAVARIPVFGAAEMARYAAALRTRGVEAAEDAQGVIRFARNGVDVRVAANAGLRAYFESQAREFRPETILTSTDDPAQSLLEAALTSGARVTYLARATLALPFGPDCAFPSASKTARIREAEAVIGVSEYVARYIREHGGMVATHVPISLFERREWPALGRFENEFVTMVNPCAVKGIAILLALAGAFPGVMFAAVPSWGTTRADREALAARPNIRVLDPVDEIADLLQRTRVLLVPSLWAEARSRIVVEAMLHGVPVLAANVGGIPEAKLGVPYLLPVDPIAHYQPRLDEQMAPVADVPAQDIGPWRVALGRMIADRAHFEDVSRASRSAALAYAKSLSVAPFEALLEATPRKPRRVVAAAEPGPEPGIENLSPEKRQLLAVKLRQRATPASWFPGADAATDMRLFCFPFAGGGAGAFSKWKLETFQATVCPVRLPGRDSRRAEAPFERMDQLVDALATAIRGFLDLPFAFFGHSMGAAVAFELARRLRRDGLPAPRLLVASAARAPQLRRNYTPGPAPTEAEFIDELRRMKALPPETLDDPLVLRAILPSLQADAMLYRNYVYVEDAPFAFPIRAYGGAEDYVPREHLEAWGEQTSGAFAVRMFPGGHLFLRPAREEVLAALAADLEQAC